MSAALYGLAAPARHAAPFQASAPARASPAAQPFGPRPCLRGSVAARSTGDDVVKGWLDLASFVSSSGSSTHTPYDELADKIGREVYLDLQGWHLYTKDVKLGQGVSLAQALAAQLGPKIDGRSFRPADLDALLKKVPIKLGGGKLTVSMADLVPGGVMRDFERVCEDYERR